jgi:hypothetical protein
MTLGLTKIQKKTNALHQRTSIGGKATHKMEENMQIMSDKLLTDQPKTN